MNHWLIHFRTRIFLILHVWGGFSLFANDNKTLIDSLEKETHIQEDTNLVKIYNELTWQYRRVSADKAIHYGNKAIELGQKTGFRKGIAQAYNDLGILYYDKHEYSKALEAYSQSLEIRQQMADRVGIAAIYNKMGIVYQVKGDYVTSIVFQQKALTLYLALNHNIGISYTYNNLAILNYDIGNFTDALTYNHASAAIKSKIGDTYGLSGSYINMANVYIKKNDFDSAIYYYTVALQLCRKVGDDEYLAANLNNLSTACFKKGDYANALAYVKESYAIRSKAGLTLGAISCLSNMANIYLKLNLLPQAKRALDEALALSVHCDARTLMPNYYGTLTIYYETLGNYKLALENQKMQYLLHDTLLNEDVNNKMLQLQATFESERKDKELVENKLSISKKEVALSRETFRRNVLVVSIVVLILLSLLVYTRLHYRQKTKYQRELLKQQELKSKAVFEAEENERRRIAQELHDGIGQQLSAAKLNISNLQAVINTTDANQLMALGNAIDLIDDSVKEVRSISHNMMPNALVKAGLAAAVREFLSRISNDNLSIELDVHGMDNKLENTIESILFRVLQEVVQNIVKHAKASVVQIQIINHGNELNLLIEDNGVGFDPLAVASEGMGLRNIKTRIAFLNGNVFIDSVPGRGTTINIEIPLLDENTKN